MVQFHPAAPDLISAISSVGRAVDSNSNGRGFESRIALQFCLTGFTSKYRVGTGNPWLRCSVTHRHSVSTARLGPALEDASETEEIEQTLKIRSLPVNQPRRLSHLSGGGFMPVLEMLEQADVGVADISCCLAAEEEDHVTLVRDARADRERRGFDVAQSSVFCGRCRMLVPLECRVG